MLFYTMLIFSPTHLQNKIQTFNASQCILWKYRYYGVVVCALDL